jgi:hypothetical protein
MGFADDIVARAKGDLNRAERDAALAREKLQKAEAEIADLQAFMRKLEHYVGPASASSELARFVPSSPKRVAAGGKSRELVDVAIERIQLAGGRRVPIAYLMQHIIERGMEIGGKDEKSNLAGYLSRDPRVDYVKPDGWGLTTEGAASAPASQEAAPSLNTGGSNDRPTLAFPDDVADLV